MRKLSLLVLLVACVPARADLFTEAMVAYKDANAHAAKTNTAYVDSTIAAADTIIAFNKVSYKFGPSDLARAQGDISEATGLVNAIPVNWLPAIALHQKGMNDAMTAFANANTQAEADAALNAVIYYAGEAEWFASWTDMLVGMVNYDANDVQILMSLYSQ